MDYNMSEYYHWGNKMPNKTNTLAPVESYIPLNPVKLLVGVSANPVELGDSDSSFGYVGNVFASLSPLQRIEYCLEKAQYYLNNDDPMQASEKLYKVAEESIKYLAKQNKITEFETAEKKGMWSTGLLNSAPPKLSEKLGKKEIAEGWTWASYLHVQGFHENRLGVAEVKYALPYVEKLVEYVREVNNGGRKDT